MAAELVRYETARKALAEAHRVDEAKDIRDKAVAMQVYAKQAQDHELMDLATDIRLRAERRAGELLEEMAEKGERETKGGNRGNQHNLAKSCEPTLPTLADLGITKDQSSRWQKLARLDADQFEEKVEKAKAKAQAAIEPPAPKKRAPKMQRGFEPWEDCILEVRALLKKWFRKLPKDSWSTLVAELHAEVDDIERQIAEES